MSASQFSTRSNGVVEPPKSPAPFLEIRETPVSRKARSFFATENSYRRQHPIFPDHRPPSPVTHRSSCGAAARRPSAPLLHAMRAMMRLAQMPQLRRDGGFRKFRGLGDFAERKP